MQTDTRGERQQFTKEFWKALFTRVNTLLVFDIGVIKRNDIPPLLQAVPKCNKFPQVIQLHFQSLGISINVIAALSEAFKKTQIQTPPILKIHCIDCYDLEDINDPCPHSPLELTVEYGATSLFSGAKKLAMYLKGCDEKSVLNIIMTYEDINWLSDKNYIENGLFENLQSIRKNNAKIRINLFYDIIDNKDGPRFGREFDIEVFKQITAEIKCTHILQVMESNFYMEDWFKFKEEMEKELKITKAQHIGEDLGEDWEKDTFEHVGMKIWVYGTSELRNEDNDPLKLWTKNSFQLKPVLDDICFI